MKIALLVIGVFMLTATMTLAGKPASPPAGSDVLLKLESDFEKATAARGWDGFAEFFADDAADLQNGGPIVNGKQAIRENLGQWAPGMSLTWKPVKAEMAASGDLGYTYGTFVFQTKDKEGKRVTHSGKYATIWKKQKDGSWKVAMDMGNAGQ